MKESCIKVETAASGKLGVGVDTSDAKTLLADAIIDSLGKGWSLANPENEVSVGDRISQIDGRSGFEDLADFCIADTILGMLVSRSP